MQSPKAVDHPACLRCGYDLRGLPPDSACPECGLSVSFSLAPPTTLSAAPPSWARTLAIGAALLLLSYLAIAVAPSLLEKIFTTPPPPAQPTMTYQLQVLQVAQRRQQVMAVILLVHALAVWILTVREPHAPRLSRRQLGIWVARLCSLGPPVALGLSTVLDRANLAFITSGLLFPILVTLYIPVPALVFLHLRRLAARIGRPRLAEHAGIVGVGCTAALALTILMFVLSMSSGADFLGMLAILPIAFVILCYFWGLFLLLRLTVAFARAIAEARATWTHFDASAAAPTIPPASS